METIIIDHARERMWERGVSEEDIYKTLSQGRPVHSKQGRFAKEYVFVYKKEWQGKFYPQKKVKAVYVEERGHKVVITVYAYYGIWEVEK